MRNQMADKNKTDNAAIFADDATIDGGMNFDIEDKFYIPAAAGDPDYVYAQINEENVEHKRRMGYEVVPGEKSLLVGKVIMKAPKRIIERRKAERLHRARLNEGI